MTAQVTLSHRQKTAYVYVRQSTMAQVRNHQESTERQYALKDKAISLGWPATSMQVLDGDLGISGATSSGRDDFKRLVAEVSLGEVAAQGKKRMAAPDWARGLRLETGVRLG